LSVIRCATHEFFFDFSGQPRVPIAARYASAE
jgi:hypothetical protein